MSGWHYIKSGRSEDETIGPLSDEELLRLAFDGQLTAETPIAHPKHTKGQWTTLGRIPAAQQRLDEGVADRKRQKAAAAQQRKTQKATEKRETKERKEAAVQDAAERRAKLPFAQFLLDGQNESVITRIYERIQEFLTPSETIEYITVQARPVQIAPDCIVLTNRRFIVVRQKMLGRLSFSDYLWRNLHDARVSEGVMYASLSMQPINGPTVSLDYLPKAQARRIYRIAQEREEEAVEERRRRQMEESKAGASNIVVEASTAAPATDDPMAKLAKLKQMLDAGLIEQEEYDATKARILSSM